jgi:hypothetical protein
MNKISSTLLNDTYNLVQLARETARLQGQKAQAERLSPLADNLRSLAVVASETKLAAQPANILAQDDFKTLLNTVQDGAKMVGGLQPTHKVAAPGERYNAVLMMAAGGMPDLEVARQMGMTRSEVEMILNLNRKRLNGVEVIK